LKAIVAATSSLPVAEWTQVITNEIRVWKIKRFVSIKSWGRHEGIGFFFIVIIACDISLRRSSFVDRKAGFQWT
jgi:hypothetical protein